MVPVSLTANTAFLNAAAAAHRQTYSGGNANYNNRFTALSQNPGSFTQFYTFPGNRRMSQQQQGLAVLRFQR